MNFEKIIDTAFRPFMEGLGFALEPLHISGRFCEASFVGPLYRLSVSFEPGDNYLQAVLLTNGEDDLKAMDDRSKSPRLSDLNARYMGAVTAEAQADNESFFRGVVSDDPMERSLIKYAKDLRLVLPLHLAS